MNELTFRQPPIDSLLLVHRGKYFTEFSSKQKHDSDCLEWNRIRLSKPIRDDTVLITCLSDIGNKLKECSSIRIFVRSTTFCVSLRAYWFNRNVTVSQFIRITFPIYPIRTVNLFAEWHIHYSLFRRSAVGMPFNCDLFITMPSKFQESLAICLIDENLGRRAVIHPLVHPRRKFQWDLRLHASKIQTKKSQNRSIHSRN